MFLKIKMSYQIKRISQSIYTRNIFRKMYFSKMRLERLKKLEILINGILNIRGLYSQLIIFCMSYLCIKLIAPIQYGDKIY